MKSLRWLLLFVMLPLYVAYAGAPKTEPRYSRVVKGELSIRESGVVISRHKIVAGPDTTNGRGLVIGSEDPKKPLTGVRIRDTMVQSNGDDGVCVWGAVRGLVIERCWFIGLYQWPDASDYSRVNKCFLADAPADWPDPNYPDWFTVRDSTFGGGFRSPKIRGGVFRFERCNFGPSRRNVWTRPRGNITDCEFTVQVGMKVQGGPNPWADSATTFVRPIALDGPLPDSLYFSGCSLKVIDAAGAIIRYGPANGPELCRLMPADGNGVGSNLDVPAATFRTRPH